MQAVVQNHSGVPKISKDITYIRLNIQETSLKYCAIQFHLIKMQQKTDWFWTAVVLIENVILEEDWSFNLLHYFGCNNIWRASDSAEGSDIKKLVCGVKTVEI